jgi:signal transduction histidine kinase
VGRLAAVLTVACGVLSLTAVAVLAWTFGRLHAEDGVGFFVVDVAQALVYGLVGGVLARRAAGGALGWLLLSVGLSHALSAVVGQYAYLWLMGVAVPGGRWALWAESWLYLPGVGVAACVLPALLPDGRLSGRVRRAVVAVAGVVIVVHTVALAARPGSLVRSEDFPNPFAVPAAATLLPIASVVGVLCAAAGPALLFARRRESTGADRTAMSWLLAGDLLLLVTLLLDVTGVSATPPYGAVAAPLLQLATLPLLPLAILVIALRHRRWGLRVAVNHALVWSLLTVGFVWAYLLAIAWLSSVLQVRGGLALPVVAAGVVAVAFEPVRSRLQHAADRLVYGDRGDPLSVLGEVARRLADPPGHTDALADVAASLVTRIRLASVTVDLARASGWERAAQAGDPVGTPVELPLVHHGEIVGRLRSCPRPGEQLRPADLELLDRVAEQLATAVFARRRDIDLRRSQRELVTAREEERRRLSRDLHDELGPTLAGIALGVRAAANVITAGRTDGLAPLLDTLSHQAGAAAQQVRHIAHDLRPPWLDEDGLLGALHRHVDTLQEPGSTDGAAVRLTAPAVLPALPAAVEVAAYRVAVEAIANVLRHAHAAECQITVTADADTLAIRIDDDGIGLPPRRRNGVGITSMQERTAELGGTLAVGDRYPTGTTVRLALPLRPRPAPQDGPP